METSANTVTLLVKKVKIIQTGSVTITPCDKRGVKSKITTDHKSKINQELSYEAVSRWDDRTVSIIHIELSKRILDGLTGRPYEIS